MCSSANRALSRSKRGARPTDSRMGHPACCPVFIWFSIEGVHVHHRHDPVTARGGGFRRMTTGPRRMLLIAEENAYGPFEGTLGQNPGQLQVGRGPHRVVMGSG